MIKEKSSMAKLMTAIIAASLVIPTVFAADIVIEDTFDISLTDTGITLKILKGGTCLNTFTVNPSSAQFTVPLGCAFEIENALGLRLDNNKNFNTQCSGTASRLSIGTASPTERTFTVTPSNSTVCSSTGSGGAGGGGGGGSVSSPAPSSGAGAGGSSAAVTAIMYDVPDTGIAASAAAVVNPGSKFRLDIAKGTTFKTDVKNIKKENYIETIAAPVLVKNADVATKSLPLKTTLLLAAKAQATIRQVKLSKFALLSMPITDAQKALGSKKLKAYYIDENTGKAKLLFGGKIDKKNNLFIAKLKKLGGVTILVQKK